MLEIILRASEAFRRNVPGSLDIEIVTDPVTHDGALRARG
jgi:hypothetical protein